MQKRQNSIANTLELLLFNHAIKFMLAKNALWTCYNAPGIPTGTLLVQLHSNTVISWHTYRIPNLVFMCWIVLWICIWLLYDYSSLKQHSWNYCFWKSSTCRLPIFNCQSYSCWCFGTAGYHADDLHKCNHQHVSLFAPERCEIASWAPEPLMRPTPGWGPTCNWVLWGPPIELFAQ